MSSSILEDNELIAQFMGGKLSKPKSLINSPYWKIPNSNNVVITHYDLYYHRLWEWIMPVVEKIQSLGFKFIIGDQNRVTVYNKDYDWRNGHTSDSLITCVWYGVVAFIKWYNEQSK